MKGAVEAVLVLVMVLAMSGWARVALVNKMEPQRPGSHRQFIVYHSNRYFAVRVFIHECTIAGSFPCIRSDAVLVNSASQKLDVSFLFLVLPLICFESCLILMSSVLVCRLIFVLLCRARHISCK